MFEFHKTWISPVSHTRVGTETYMLTPVRPGKIYQPRIWAKGALSRPRNSLTGEFLSTPPSHTRTLQGPTPPTSFARR